MKRLGYRWYARMAIAAVLLLLATDTLVEATGSPHPANGLRNATVLIIRHAEKPKHGRGLSHMGWKRAHEYVSYFHPLQLDGSELVPDRLIATSNTLASKRPLETLQPLANELGLPVEQGFSKDSTDGLVSHLRRTNNASVILISWHHGHLDNLARSFGARSWELAQPWPSDSFSKLLVLRFDENGALDESRSEFVQEHLLAGD